VIGRKTTIGKKQYKQVMVYVPSQISLDSLFQSMFEIGKPVEIVIDGKNMQMVVKPVEEEAAKERGWVRRDRSKN
jgi:hypothetical protein